MSKAHGTNREHEQYTHQGIADVAAPATVKVSLFTKARIPATRNLNPMLSGEIVKGKKMSIKTLNATNTDVAINETLKARILAVAFGAAILFVVGFSHSTTAHNAAHDTRHALAFPCH